MFIAVSYERGEIQCRLSILTNIVLTQNKEAMPVVATEEGVANVIQQDDLARGVDF